MAPGNKGCECSDAAGKHLVPSFVHFNVPWISSKHVAYQSFWIYGWRGAGARGSASSIWTGVARRMVTCPTYRSARMNMAAALSNSALGQAIPVDCERFAVTDKWADPLLDSSVCRVLYRGYGYRGDLVKTERIAALSGVPEFGLSLLYANVSRAVRPIVTSCESTPGEADPRRTNTRVRTPCGAPGHENCTSRCISGFSQVFVLEV